MAAYIALFISLVSFILMIIIIVRFKKLFSTDAIIEKTKSQMNRVIMDINNNADRDLQLIQDSTKRLRALLNEADKKMESFREATQLLRDAIAEAEKAGSKSSKQVVYMEAKRDNSRLSDIKPVGETQKKNTNIDPYASYKVRNPSDKENQRSLFDEVEPEENIIKDETILTQDGAAYKEVPLIITKVYDDKASSISPNSSQTLKEKVEKLFNQGMKVEDIASELSCSISEVQFIIDII